VPGSNPATVPEDNPTVATVVLLLLHVPPLVKFPSVVVNPEQTVAVPEIPDGNGFVVTGLLVEQPVESV
jgi:hypothetical protein